jgi:hypothetical protein
MRRSIPYGCVARRLNSLLFALLAPCHAGASTPENVNLFLGEPLSETVSQAQAPIRPKITVGKKGGKAYSEEKPVIGNIPVPKKPVPITESSSISKMGSLSSSLKSDSIVA